jgi:dihydroflavonol-4-reductase
MLLFFSLLNALTAQGFSMKAFVTGGNGFVGSFLVEKLLEKGYTVKCLVRKTSNLRWLADLDIECFYGSLSDKNSLRRGIEDCDHIFHVAGVTKARTEAEYFAGNFEGTRNLTDVCVESTGQIERFVNISSQAAVGPSPTMMPIDESHPPNPLTYYGKSKLAAEQYVMQFAETMKITNLRPPAVYGPRETDILEFFRTVRTGIIPQLGGVDKYLSLIHVRDLVRGILMATENPAGAGKTYFLTSVKPYSWKEISQIALKVFGKKGIRIPVPLMVIRGIAVVSEGIAAMTKKPALVNQQKIIEMKQDFWTCSPDKAKRELGFESEIGLEDGIRETITWYKNHRWL